MLFVVVYEYMGIAKPMQVFVLELRLAAGDADSGLG
jgi:hypothetical protein